MPNKRTIDNGYIKLYRKFFDSELWQEKRKYSKAEAWIDLIEMARWGEKPETLLDKRGSYVLDFGDIYISARFLGIRWQWSKNKVIHFLEYLEKRESILFKKRDSHRTIINLINLKVYLGWENGKKDREGTGKGQGRDREGTKKNPEEPIKPEEPKPTWEHPEGLDEKAWGDYVEFRELPHMKKKAPFTDAAKTISANKLIRFSSALEEQQDIVDNSIESGWTGIYALNNKQGKLSGGKLKWKDR